MFVQLDLFILQWEEVPGSGFDLMVLDPSDRKGNRHVCIIATKDKKMGSLSAAIDNGSCLHHVIVLIALLRFSMNLIH